MLWKGVIGGEGSYCQMFVKCLSNVRSPFPKPPDHLGRNARLARRLRRGEAAEVYSQTNGAAAAVLIELLRICSSSVNSGLGIAVGKLNGGVGANEA